MFPSHTGGKKVTERQANTQDRARCLQHECEHLAGGVYVDRLRGWRHRRLMRQVARASWRR